MPEQATHGCQSEDCGVSSEVFIWVPDVAPGSLLPVLVRLDLGHRGVLPGDGIHVAGPGVGGVVVVA